jgi:hypothetical protein
MVLTIWLFLKGLGQLEGVPTIERQNRGARRFLQQRYGYGKAQAEIEINNWLRDHDRARNE